MSKVTAELYYETVYKPLNGGSFIDLEQLVTWLQSYAANCWPLMHILLVQLFVSLQLVKLQDRTLATDEGLFVSFVSHHSIESTAISVVTTVCCKEIMPSMTSRCWLGDRKDRQPVQAECRCADDCDFTGALHILEFRLSPLPPPLSLAAGQSRTV